MLADGKQTRLGGDQKESRQEPHKQAQNTASQLGAQKEAAPKNADAAGQENSPESDGFAMPSLGA